ncbi:hypothetical protein [Nocardia transvalensis]|uniref:hypothetical protein n=1 Tax=Nocardia transvalensis TaxID=37333 RepID=UPI0018938BC9|nr:hypothetical protein [Nocardia transvalensis]MBF6332791.1 hypothetical protein [Nocardia transvalensis]
MTTPPHSPQQYLQQYRDGIRRQRDPLERSLRDDKSNNNVFVQEAWNPKPPDLTGLDVNRILDAAAPGLEWFKLALVRYHRVYQRLGSELPGFDRIVVPQPNFPGFTGPVALDPDAIIHADQEPDVEMQRLEGRYYDQQRRMNIANLRGLAARITGAALGHDTHPGATDITGSLAGVATAVPEYWEGQSGRAAGDHLAGFHAHADQQTQYLQAVAAALNGLPDVLEDIVRDKASFVAGFDSPQCPVAGHAMRLHGAEDPVSVIITAAADDDFFRSYLDDVKDQLNLHGVNDREVREACKAWLQDCFGPAVRAAFTAFVQQCQLADYFIKQAYKPVIELLDSHDPTPFPKPQDQPIPPQQGQPTVPVSTVSAGVTGGDAGAAVQTAGVDSTAPSTVTPPPQQAPTAVNPAAVQGNPLQALAGLASQASQPLQQGLTQVASTVSQGLGGLGASPFGAEVPVADTGATAGSKTLANLNLAGGNLALTQAPNGTVTATVTGPDGKSQRYSMGIRNGVPFFTPDAEPAAKPPVTANTHDSGLPAAATGAGSSAGFGGTPAQHPSPITASGTPAGRTPNLAGADNPSVSLAGNPQSTTGTSAGDPSTSAMPMGGMPMGGMPAGGAAGGKGAPDGERNSSGIVPPRPLWSDLPGRDGPTIDAPGAAELASVGNLDDAPGAPELAVAGPLNDGATLAPRPIAALADHPMSESPPPQPAPRTDGVKIEIDMGDQR